jgi:hypothetical protein
MERKRVGLGMKEIPFPGPQVTWAGEFPWRFEGGPLQPKHLCFGTDDGSIFVMDREGKTLDSLKSPRNLESINGVAFTESMMAVSTPAEVVVLTKPTPQVEPRSFLFEQGAHEVIATGRGEFLAPMGLKGVMHLRKRSEEVVQRNDFRHVDFDIYFYKMAYVGMTGEGTEIVACAARRHGLLTVSIDSEGKPEWIGMNKGQGADGVQEIDVIDVCPLPSDEYPFAVVALGIDNTLHFTFDIRHENPSMGLRFQEMRGTAYTLLAGGGHLFVLTSEEFYILPGLGARFLSKERFRTKVPVFRHPIAAFDCSIAYGELILLIREGAVAVYEISKLLPHLTFSPDEHSRVDETNDTNLLDEMTPGHIKSNRDSPRFFALEEVLG